MRIALAVVAACLVLCGCAHPYGAYQAEPHRHRYPHPHPHPHPHPPKALKTLSARTSKPLHAGQTNNGITYSQEGQHRTPSTSPRTEFTPSERRSNPTGSFLWVSSRHNGPSASCPLYPNRGHLSARADVRYVPIADMGHFPSAKPFLDDRFLGHFGNLSESSVSRLVFQLPRANHPNETSATRMLVTGKDHHRPSECNTECFDST